VELTPVDQHRQNAAEQAIQTFKGHFISVLAGVDNSFPINQWDELLPQTILTLNLLGQSNVAPNISAWAYHHPWDALSRSIYNQAEERLSVSIRRMDFI